MKKSLNKISENAKSTTYEIVWHDILAGELIVPNATDKSIDFIARAGIDMTHARQIASWLYTEFRRDIFVRTEHRGILLTRSDFEKSPTRQQTRAKKTPKIKTARKTKKTLEIQPRQKIKPEIEEKNVDVPQTPNVDPMILAKTLTVTMKKKQTLDVAKLRAQQMANLEYVAVKLLDPDGKFICTMYPQNIEQIRATRLEYMKRFAHKQYF